MYYTNEDDVGVAQWYVDDEIIVFLREKTKETDLSITKQLNKDLRELYGIKKAKKL